METPFSADSLDSAASPLDWETMMPFGEDSNLTMRKRDRPLSFDVGPLLLPEGLSQFSWGQDFPGNQNGDGKENESGQLFGGYGERVGSFVADSGSSAGNPNNQNPASTSGSSHPFPNFDLFNNTAPYAREPSDRPAVGAQAPFTRQVSDPLPATSPAVVQLAPSRSQRVVSKSMNLDEIYTAYAQSWGGALKAVPKGGVALQRKPQVGQPPKRTESKAERAANAAKAEAAGIIRDLFRRPGAKRQAVPLERGQVGSLERGFSQLASFGISGQVAPPQAATSASSGENVISPAESQSASLPPVTQPPVHSKRSDFSTEGLGLNTGLPDGLPGNASNDLASLQKEAQALLAAMGGPPKQGKTPPAGPKSAVINPSFTLGGKEEPRECPLVRAVEVAGCQVALACPMELDAELFSYSAWGRISDGCPSREKLKGQMSAGEAGWGTLDSLDWLLQTADGVNGLDGGVNGPDSGNGAAGPPDGSSANSSLWPSDFSDLMPNGSVRKVSDQDPAPSGVTGVERNQFHHLWAQLELSQLRDARFCSYRTAYREEVRRLRIWTASFVGEVLLPRVADLHFVSCNALPNLRDRHVRMMLTKGMLWNAFVTHSLTTASPTDIYFARQDGSQAYKGTKAGGLDRLTPGMQLKCKNMCFVAEDLKDESTYGPEVFRTYGALRKSVGADKPPPPGYAGQQVTFPELTDPKPGQVSSLTDPPPELIQIDGLQSVAKCTSKDGLPMRWGMLWMNKQRLLSTGLGMREAGERARISLQALFERTIEAHVEKYDVMASGAAPTLDRYLNYARYESGAMVSMGLAFCAIGQELADAAAWEPTVDEVEQLFEETARATELAGNVLRIMSDLRTYQADLVQLRLNAVAIRMREAHCSHKEALEFLVARAAADIEALGAEIKTHAAKGAFAPACWRLPFELCRVGVALFTVLGADARAADLFEVGAATVE